MHPAPPLFTAWRYHEDSMGNLHQKTSDLPYSRLRPAINVVSIDGWRSDMKQETFDLKTATEVVMKVLKLNRGSDKAKDVRIPAEIMNNDVFFGA